MKSLFTQEQFDLAKSEDKLLCQCYYCNNSFEITKHKIKDALNPNHKAQGKFCSNKCQAKTRQNKPTIKCTNCDTTFKKELNQMKRSTNHFCTRSCAISFNNKNKTFGNRRSKIEFYIENELTKLYPNLFIDYNNKTIIGSELDIYISSLNIAFELNGIFHYQPIFGVNKLNQTKLNDESKIKKCFDKKIDFCIIDISEQKYFKPSTSQKYLNIIINIINERLILLG